MKPLLILASQSPYRQELLSRLKLPFIAIAPHVDETRHSSEKISEMVSRLANNKAEKIARQHPDSWIIASDQSVEIDQTTLGKPGNFESALAQLSLLQGKTVAFHTSLCLRTPAFTQTHIDQTRVTFRTLSQNQLIHYLEQEKPYNCAGSFKSEGLGITLLSRIDSQDPTALIGLPMITLANWLTDAGYLLVGNNQN